MTAVTEISERNLQDYYSLGISEICGDEGDSFPVDPQNGNRLQAEPYARGMSVRFGRSAFLYWLRENQESLGWEDIDFKLLSSRKKLNSGLKVICQWFEKEVGRKLLITDLGDEWQVLSETILPPQHPRIPHQWEFLQGFLQEFTRWVGQGRLYKVRLIQDENHITLTIAKLPFD